MITERSYWLTEYLRLEQVRAEIRAEERDGPFDEGVLEKMDEIWFKLTDEERRYLDAREVVK